MMALGGRGYLEATDGIDCTSGVLFKYQVQLMLPRLALQNKYSALHSAAQLQTKDAHAADTLRASVSVCAVCSYIVQTLAKSRLPV